MRPLTNSAFVIDFFRYRNAPYFHQMADYLKHLKLDVPEYQLQYQQVLQYFKLQKTLHKCVKKKKLFSTKLRSNPT